MHLLAGSLAKGSGLIFLLAIAIQSIPGYTDTAAEIRKLEQRIEEAVVKAEIKFLETVYSNDFRFTHGDGEVQNKAQWLELAAKREVKSRKISTTEVEIHGKVVITAGRLDVIWQGEEKDDVYALKYVRVYEKRKGRWILLSHRTIEMLKT